jgi:IS66 C-terminal element
MPRIADRDRKTSRHRPQAYLGPQAYLADILAKLVNGWPAQKLDDLLPWAWTEQNRLRLAA